ncbi:MAG: hypothetical protein A2Y62_21805 [Candidatus Fischerbacteria bacterium RBG_13_37_8]|uniref:Type I restriction modification DNA specificity domain-containing protein n=1 Tax=Candidatus Fischerbacteria bacterium RBG_13_37_8 TaxID=1817863 RepID=A0A1F5VTK7_9BACT|nr:MAG: hypothetical protein A2Y62_21805 [Candidatus Fischerbacteria bacterium RBG_13_37_8]
MKDSCIPWISLIPFEWSINKIKFTSYVKGRIGWHGLKSEEFIDNGPYLITGTDFEKGKISWETCVHVSEERYQEDPYIHLKNNDLLLTKDGTIGKVALIKNLPYKTSLNSGVMLIRPLNSYTNRFMYWVLNSNVFACYISFIKTGSTIQHLYQETFENFSFPVPTFEDQIAIADFLNRETAKIDALIEKKEKLIALLKEKRQALITHAVTKGLNPDVKMKNSGIPWIGRIPEHWKLMPIKYELESLDNRRIPISAEVRGTMSNKIYDYYGASGIIDKVENYIFDETLILIGEDGANLYARSTPLAFLAKGKYWVNNHAHVLRPYHGNNEYFVNLLESLDYTIFITGSAQPKLTIERLMNIKIPVPPIAEQNVISCFIEKITIKFNLLSEKIENQINKLKELRQALISNAVTGKIDVRGEA